MLHLRNKIKFTGYLLEKVNYNSFSTKSLLKLPVPQLSSTLSKYLNFLQPLLTKNELEHTRSLVDNFQKSGEGELLQNLLLERASKTENWLSEWWTEVAYLEGRDPIVVNSNPGLRLPVQNFRNSDDWIRFSVNLLQGFLKYKWMIDTDQLAPDMQKMEPLCMSQYYTLFSTCRIPGQRKDSIYTAGSHRLSQEQRPDFITVVHRNRFFSMTVMDRSNGKIHSKEAIFRGFCKILEMSNTKGQPLGLMTAENRNVWGTAFCRLQEIAINRESFAALQRSILLFCLDSPLIPEAKDRDSADSMVARNMLHGCGHKVNSANRWFDKTVQLISSSDGSCGLNYEHTPAEAPPLVAIINHAYTNAVTNAPQEPESIATDVEASPVVEVEFSLDPRTREDIDIAKANINSLVKDLELHAVTFADFGKKRVKAAGVGPDAFVQMGIQLGYYRMHGQPGSTYESGSLRRYALGRTDTIRSCSPEATAFSIAMQDKSVSAAERRKLLLTALTQHSAYTKAVLNAEGIDRHLLGLRLIAVESRRNIPELFMDTSYSRATHHLISTSQGSSKVELTMCFGPLVPDGYGFCYNPTSNKILFCASAINSSPDTKASQLAVEVQQAWRDIIGLLEMDQ